MNARRLTLASAVSICIAVLALLALAGAAFAALPDNRIDEMVSPVNKGGGASLVVKLVVTDAGGEHAVVDGGAGNSLLSTLASWMLETRTPTGWSGVQVGPPPGTDASYQEQSSTELAAVSENFSRFAFQTAMSLNPRDLGPSVDLYVRDSPTGPFNWATVPPATAVKETGPPLGNYANGQCLSSSWCLGNSVVFAGASADLGEVVWGQREPLVSPPGSLAGSPPDTHTYGYEVYASENGSEQLVGLVPSAGIECNASHGTCVVPQCGAAMGNAYYESDGQGVGGSPGFATTEGAVSKDGSQVIFTSPDPATEQVGCAPPEVYVRQGGSATVQASASQKTNGGGLGGRDLNGPRPKTYAGSLEEDGRIVTVFFTSSEELTDQSNTGSADQGTDLYAYSLSTGRVTDLTPDSNVQDPNGAGVVGLIGSAADGSRVYFTASGVLAAGASAGQPNLYVYDARNGHTTFIAPGAGVAVSSEVTPDGRHLVFLSSENLTSYNQEGNVEVYLYDAPSASLVCVSCNPSGAAPVESAVLPGEPPSGAENPTGPRTLGLPRVVSDDGGRVFFTSPDQLTTEAPLPAPKQSGALLTFGQLEPNVYEYERGHLQLVAAGAALSTVTPSGDDVFFNTLAQLVVQDRDGSPDVYDARVGGGFPQLAAPACSGTSCQGVPAAAPIFATPASVVFNGVGNFPAPAAAAVVKAKVKSKPARCRKGLVRKHGRCVRRAKAKKSAKGRK